MNNRYECLEEKEMAKYNINVIKNKEAAYRSLINPDVISDLKLKILDLIYKKKKYRDSSYSARKLAEELGTNTRCISAAVNVCFGMNYTSFVNKYRIEYAKSLLTDKRYAKLKMEEISDMVGFSNRQSFYASFYKFTGGSPRKYKIEHYTRVEN